MTAGAAVAVLCVVAGAGAAQAQVTAAGRAHPARLAGVPGIRVVNLHQQFVAAARKQVHVGKVAITRPLNWHGRAGAKVKGAACTEPNCSLGYGNGPVQHNPRVLLVFWGPNWGSDLAESYLNNFYTGLGVAPQDTWSPVTSQYGDSPTGFPQFTGRVLESAVQDTSTPPAGATTLQIAQEADGAASYFSGQGIPINGNVQIVIATPSGTFPECFDGVNCHSGDRSYCGWHNAFSAGTLTNIPFTNLPYQLDAGTNCGENFVNSGSAGTYDGFSMIGGHEYAESITDPVPATGWADTSDTISGGEIGDKCVWGGRIWGGHDPYGDVTLSTGTFAMQSLWDNLAGGCVMTPSEDTVTLGSAPDRIGYVGVGVSVQLTGSSSGGYPLEWYATGLPAGLSINTATGLISGTPTTAGDSTVTVYVSDYTGAASSASFDWLINTDTVTVTNPGNPTGFAQAKVKLVIGASSSGSFYPLTFGATGLPAGLTLNTSTGVITGAPATPGSYPVSVTATDTIGHSGATSFTWTVQANVGSAVREITAGVCLNDSNSKITAGNPVTVSACNGRGLQKWTFPAAGPGELIVFGMCLNDPRSGGTGTSLTLAKCTGATSEVWTYTSTNEYVLELNGLCLTDPNGSAINGTKVTVATCTGQRWTKA